MENWEISRYLSQLIPMLIGRDGDTKGKRHGEGFEERVRENRVRKDRVRKDQVRKYRFRENRVCKA